MEQLDLVGKQVKCYIDSKTIDYNALSILQILYPDFQTVYSVFDIYPGIPFIYLGELKYISKVKERKEPYIIVSTTGEKDFTDKEELLKVVYAHHKKEVPQYIKDIWETWTQNQFYCNLKLIALLGSSVDKEFLDRRILINIINNVASPVRLTKEYLRDTEKESTEYLENDLLSFIDRSANIDRATTKNKKSLRLRATFYQLCKKNLSVAINNLVESNIENLDLRNLNFLLDLIWLDRS